MKKIILYSFLLSAVVFSSCTTTKKLTNDNGPSILNGVTEASALLELVEATQTSYTWFSGEGDGTIDWEGNRYSAKMKVRILHDSIIWVVIQKFGFEIGRMLVTPDSAFFINRLERSYSAYNTTDFFKKYNLPVDFNMFSKVFTGGAFIPGNITQSKIQDDHSLYVESSTGVNASYWLDASSTLARSLVIDPFHHQWEAGYGDYRSTNTSQMFPFHRANTLDDNGKSSVFDLDYSSITIDVTQEFPFSVPSNYEKI